MRRHEKAEESIIALSYLGKATCALAIFTRGREREFERIGLAKVGRKKRVSSLLLLKRSRRQSLRPFDRLLKRQDSRSIPIRGRSDQPLFGQSFRLPRC